MTSTPHGCAEESPDLPQGKSGVRVARPDLVEEYSVNLREYLAGGGEASLKKAGDRARRAMAEGVGLLEMAAVHHEALGIVMQDPFEAETLPQRFRAAETLLIESLTPFETARQSYEESNTALRQLGTRREDEVRRIARELHAEAGQLLVSAFFVIESMSLSLTPEAQQKVARLRELLDQVSRQIRSLSHQLSPAVLEDLGLLPALRFLAEGVSSRSRIAVTVEGQLGVRLIPAVETTIYSAVQEALSNVTKHAGATTAVVQVMEDSGKIVCSVHDNGAGFDEKVHAGISKKLGIGLIGIRDRLQTLHGTLQINSAPGRGTDLIITVPREG